nr:hypothetical protein IPBHJEJL_00158 [Klebsiella oxytoca]
MEFSDSQVDVLKKYLLKVILASSLSIAELFFRN